MLSNVPPASITPWLHAARLPFLNYKTTVQVLVWKVGRKKVCFVISISAVMLKLRVKINHIHFRLILVLNDSIAWHFVTFTSPSSKLEFVYLPCCGVEEEMLIFSSRLTPGRVKGSWIKIQSQVNHRTHLKDSYVSKICRNTSNRGVENMAQRKLLVWEEDDARSHPPNFLVFLFELIVEQCILVKK